MNKILRKKLRMLVQIIILEMIYFNSFILCLLQNVLEQHTANRHTGQAICFEEFERYILHIWILKYLYELPLLFTVSAETHRTITTVTSENNTNIHKTKTLLQSPGIKSNNVQLIPH